MTFLERCAAQIQSMRLRAAEPLAAKSPKELSLALAVWRSSKPERRQRRRVRREKLFLIVKEDGLVTALTAVRFLWVQADGAAPPPVLAVGASEEPAPDPARHQEWEKSQDRKPAGQIQKRGTPELLSGQMKAPSRPLQAQKSAQQRPEEPGVLSFQSFHRSLTSISGSPAPHRPCPASRRCGRSAAPFP